MTQEMPLRALIAPPAAGSAPQPDAAAPLRLLVVDDHDLFRTGMGALLEELGFEVAASAGGADAVRRAATCAPDVVLMDINMPGMSGVEATPLLLETAPRAAVVMLTVATDDAQVVAAIQAGACGYLLQDAGGEQIAAGGRAAPAGRCVIAPRVAGALLRSVRSGGGPPEGAPPAADPGLSARERQVLALLAEGRD